MIPYSSSNGHGTPGRIEAILFDVGGVLVNDLIDEKTAELSRKYSVSLDEMMRARQQFRIKTDLGQWSDPQFWQELLAQVGIASDPTDGEIESYMRPIEGTLDVVRELKGLGLRIAIVSNDSKEMAALRRRLFGFDAIFHTIVISSAIGIVKPEGGIYTLACRRLEVDPQQCVFIDDRPENVQAAMDLGMTGILFRDAADLRVALRGAGIPIAL
jgi:putative hydrolase of the HAD superfamily